jgi:hypothetical protein
MIKITRKKVTQVFQRKMNFFDNENSIKNDSGLRPRNFQAIEGRFEEVISCSFFGDSRGQRIIGPNSTVSLQAKVDGFIVKVDSLRIEFAGTSTF